MPLKLVWEPSDKPDWWERTQPCGRCGQGEVTNGRLFLLSLKRWIGQTALNMAVFVVWVKLIGVDDTIRLIQWIGGLF